MQLAKIIMKFKVIKSLGSVPLEKDGDVVTFFIKQSTTNKKYYLFCKVYSNGDTATNDGFKIQENMFPAFRSVVRKTRNWKEVK